MRDFFREKSERFLAYLDENLGYSPRTLYTYRINLREMLSHVEIVMEEEGYLLDLMPYRMHLQNRHKRTVYKKISIVKSFVSYLYDQGIKIRVRNDDMVKVPKTLPKPVPKAYIEEALALCDHEERVLLLLAYGAGLRISEIANLKLESIQNGWVRIKGKGDKIRQLPLLRVLKNALRDHMRANGVRRYIFEKSGKKLSENQIRYRIQKLFRKIGIKVTPHQLRHAFATDLLDEGARITDVSALLGHSSLETTQIYTQLSSQAKMRNYQKAHPLCRESDGTTNSD